MDADFIQLIIRTLIQLAYHSQQDNKTRVSLPYDDIFESASSLLRFPSTSTAVPDTPRSRSKRQRQEEDHETNMDTTAEDEASAALLAEDMRRFGDLDCTRKAMRCICAEQSRSMQTEESQ